MLQFPDYMMIIFYLLFMLALGPVFKSFNRNSSDFFRGGGNMAWWIAAASMFMTGFSAWSYTGAAGKIYQAGIFFLTLTIANFLGTVFTVFFTAHRFRQMRVITGPEAVRNRYGKINEQIVTWLPMPFNILFGGIALYTISQFMSCVFVEELSFLNRGWFNDACVALGLDGAMVVLIIVLTTVIVIMTMLGGSWAATGGDFVQMLILVTVSISVVVLVLYSTDINGSGKSIGGITGLIEKIKKKPELYDINSMSRMWIFIPYLLTLILNQTILGNNLSAGASRFVFVKTGKDARRICAVSWLAALPQTAVIMIPPLACAVLFTMPELQEMYPKLVNPQEAGYIHIAGMVLPQGMRGLLVCGIFAATLTSMNSGLNSTSGSIIRNIYLPLINPSASEERQVKLGRVFTLVLGVLYALTAILFSTLKTLPLYELVLITATCTGIPQAVPMMLGMFHAKAPDWAAWSTLAIGFASSIASIFILSTDNLSRWFAAYNLSANELNDLKLAITTAVLIFICVSWFYFTMSIPVKRSAAVAKRVRTFFMTMNTPIDPDKECPHAAYSSDARQFDVLGKLSMVYGISILALLIFDNVPAGKLAILGSGGFISWLGVWLIYCGRRRRTTPVKEEEIIIYENEGVEENAL
jgi:Na+/proline symporter